MILYEGPSMLDGAPIVVIATAGSDNAKTGPMVQTWILLRDNDPIEASQAVADGSICGDCPHRRSTGGACYVTLHQAPLSVWRAYHRGVYSGPEAARKVARALERGASVRLGAYGDPAAVPAQVWRDFVAQSKQGHTGYTHQWRNPVAAELRTLCMASCDTDDDVADAVAAGWRYFRVLGTNDAPPARSVECLSDSKGKTCTECGLCDGARADRDIQPISVWIRVHGALAGRFETATNRGRKVAALRVVA